MGVKSLVQGLNAAATAGFEPRTVWSEVRRRNRLATAPLLFDVASSMTSRYVWQHSSHGFMSHFLSHIFTSYSSFVLFSIPVSERQYNKKERLFVINFLSSFGKTCWMYNTSNCSLTLQFSFRWKCHSTFNLKLSSVLFLQFSFLLSIVR